MKFTCPGELLKVIWPPVSRLLSARCKLRGCKRVLVGVTEAEVPSSTSLVGVHIILYRLRSTARPCTTKEERTIKRNGSNSSSGVVGMSSGKKLH